MAFLTRLHKNKALLLTMLGLALLGAAVRWLVSPEQALGGDLLGGVLLLPPVLIFAALCISQRLKAVRWGSGLGAALGAGYANFVLLDPQLNQDANIGLGLYGLGGFVPVLGVPALLGAGVGWLLASNRLPKP